MAPPTVNLHLCVLVINQAGSKAMTGSWSTEEQTESAATA